MKQVRKRMPIFAHLILLTAIIMPDDVAQEKVNTLKCLGADVERVRPASIIDTKHVSTSIT